MIEEGLLMVDEGERVCEFLDANIALEKDAFRKGLFGRRSRWREAGGRKYLWRVGLLSRLVYC